MLRIVTENLSIYEIDKDSGLITIVEIGSHSQLFG
jgi:mRNA-degrading endonuclease YafQ of YafQ-DinJ toxin-antitoxin module